VVDISENGAAVLVGGRTATGFAVKLHVILVGYDIVLCGTVRHSRYREQTNRSVLHIEAIQPSAKMRNRILCYVYEIFDESKRNEKQEIENEDSEINGETER
jgi:Ran GTPase-activating protein (RanGAP) involved in mRNA processing and transport